MFGYILIYLGLFFVQKTTPLVSSSNIQFVRTDDNICTDSLISHLPNKAFTASSVLENNEKYQSYQARKNVFNDIDVEAWCPNSSVSSKPSEWLQIEFDSPYCISTIFTKGRMEGNYGEFINFYYLHYQRTEKETSTWHSFKEPFDLKETLIVGNTDFRYNANRKFESPIIARRIRIIPINKDGPKKVCLKLSIYGCKFPDHILEYNMTQGDSKRFDGTDYQLFDNSYDGQRILNNNVPLIGGIGRLMDNRALINMGLKLEKVKQEMVAWQRKYDREFVEILFQFTNVRKFQNLRIYPIIQSDWAMDLFKKLQIDFELTTNKNRIAQSKPSNNQLIIWANEIQNRNELYVDIDLKHHIGDIIRLKLYFQDDWLGLTEVVFKSEPTIVPIIPIIPGNTSPGPKGSPGPPLEPFINYNILLIVLSLLGAIVFCALAIIICCVCIKHWNRHHSRSKFSKLWGTHPYTMSAATHHNGELSYAATQRLHHVAHNYGPVPTISASTSNPTMLCRGLSPYAFDPINQSNNNLTIRCLTAGGAHSTNQQLINSTSFEPIRRQHNQHSTNDYEAIDNFYQKSAVNNNGKFNDIERHQFMKMTPPDITANNTLTYPIPPPLPPSNTYNNNTDSSYSSIHYSRPMSEAASLPPPDLLTIPSLTTNDSNITNITNQIVHKPIQGPLGSTLTLFDQFDGSRKFLEEKDLRLLTELPKNSIYINGTLVEGRIGCKLSGQFSSSIDIDDNLDESGIQLGGGIREHKIIIIKPKQKFKNISERSLFYREMLSLIPLNTKRDLSSVLHDNLPSLLGTFLFDPADDIRSLVFSVPNTSNNLVYFFNKIRRQMTSRSSTALLNSNSANFTCNYISHTSLLYMAQQISSCMEYISIQLGLVHRDLSARNIHVSEGFHITVLDTAIGTDEFQNDYICITNENDSNTSTGSCAELTVRLPFRWMAWEAMIMSNYSPKTDVWSFGVVLWELLTECQSPPYSLFNTASQLIHNATFIANNHPSSILPNGRTLETIATSLSLATTDLQQHQSSSSPIIDSSRAIQQLIGQCWTPDPSMRPNFNQLTSSISRLYHSVAIVTVSTNNNAVRPNSYQQYQRPYDEYGAIMNEVINNNN